MTGRINDFMIKADQMFFEADNMIKEGRIPEAKELLMNLVNTYPEYGRAYNHLGWIHETKYKEYVKAEDYYRKALEFAPDYPAVYLNFAVVLSTLEKFGELKQLLDRALTVPGISKDKIYNEFGIMYEIQGKYPEAMEAFKKSIAYTLDNKEVELYKNSMARCESKQGIFSVR